MFAVTKMFSLTRCNLAATRYHTLKEIEGEANFACGVARRRVARANASRTIET